MSAKTTAAGSKENGQRYHVFAFGEIFLFKKASGNKIDIDVEIPVGSVIIRGVFLGQLEGNLNDSVSIKSSIPSVSEDRTLFVRDGSLWIRFSLTVLGETYSAKFELFRIPGKADLE
ncbi:hypothetical protein FIBSPDRAFT_892475 [Athelia psychrophila]|uniref:Uncharacterized protein n=1 Tax=Athelia psychrophila TaxID=1759441 RepID=A0A166IDI7_9AGAM|nr:hypothetical protein FIBSPDRAFT_892475 [Fibularhizoctonia sp. CBS 109695]